MTLIAVGINHNTAPVAIRERLSYPADELARSLKDLTLVEQISEAAILSTCNRTELYCTTNTDDQQILIDWMAQNKNISATEFSPFFIHPCR
nr:hypothetical protein [Methylocucumis oryzae]